MTSSGVLDGRTSTERAAGSAPAARLGGRTSARRGHRPSAGATGLAIADATELLSDIGYLLVPGSPFDEGPAYLLVAVRPRPTHAHFDPERIEFWSQGPDQAERATIAWPMSAPSGEYSWGRITVIDRVAAESSFVSFGGSLAVSHDGSLSAALFRSDAPILAVGGRGEAGDPLASAVIGFFARLQAACGADAEMARRATAAGPLALYAAYLAQTLKLHGNQLELPSRSPRLQSLLHSEHCRLTRDFSAAADAGDRLARELEASLA